MSVFALLAAAALLFWVNVSTRTQPTKAISYIGAWLLLILAVTLIFLGIPNLGVLL